jgi:hypothetical protein
VDGEASGPKEFNLTCGSDGKYTWVEKPSLLMIAQPTPPASKGPAGSSAEGCKPVKCGPAVVPPNSKKTGGPEALVYKEKAEFECLPGYGLTKSMASGTSFSAVCLANGTQSYHAGCVNKNDCEGNQCAGPDGSVNKCVDNAEPTGVHIDDYHCECDPGFAENVTSSLRTCYNINDCPEKDGKPTACLPGSCEDLVLDYKCLCPPGYFEGPTAEFKHDCKPVKCGVPPEGAFSKTETTADQYFAMPPVDYDCDLGYTLSGVAGTTAAFSIACQTDATFEKVPPCKPVVCGQAPESDHTTRAAGASYVFPQKAPYDCNTGYSLDGLPAGTKSFEASCEADGEFTGVKACKPVECSPLDAQENAHFDTARKLVFQDTLEVTCDPGHALEAVKHDDITYEVTCTADGTLKVPPVKCVPIDCGKAPVVKFSTMEGSTLFGGKMVYTAVEGYTLSGMADGIKTFKITCLATGGFSSTKEFKPVLCPELPEVAHATTDSKKTWVFPQEAPYNCVSGYSTTGKADGIKTFVTPCLADGTFKVDHKCLPVECPLLPDQPNAEWDKQVMLVFPEHTTVKCLKGFALDKDKHSDTDYRIKCTADGSLQRFEDERTCVPVDCGAMPVAEYATGKGSTLFGEKVTYTLEKGYSTTGEFGGPTTFTLECDEDGVFPEISSPPLPNSCGVASTRKHATSPGLPHVFGEFETFSCLKGYSVNGQATGPKTFELECEPDGTYPATPEGCKPVACGDVVVPSNSKQRALDGSKKFELFFGEEAGWVCLPGYSLDGKMAGPLEFTTECKADGKISSHPGCRNMDDCEGNKCGAHGTCVDNADPTGDHPEDYHCKCDSGFKEEIKPNKDRVCGNIPDCPPGACLPGSCQDLVNDYECHCPPGYTEGKSAEFKHDCNPNKCGAPPKMAFASTKRTGDVYFAEPPVKYTCLEGYTLDGAAGTTAAFEIDCQTDGTFETHPGCKPVSCGVIQPALHAKFEAGKEHFFPEEAAYACDDGYSVDGESAGAVTFKRKCGADGHYSGAHAGCKPMKCPAIPKQPHAEYSAEVCKLVFPKVCPVKCSKGYALNKDKQGAEFLVDYQIDCVLKSGGGVELKFPTPGTCVAVDCGPAPEVPHAKLEAGGSTLFGGELKYTIDDCYTLTGAPDGEKSFTLKCTADGVFVDVPAPMKVVCGPSPSAAHATLAMMPADNNEWTCNEQLPFQCAEGFTVDGTSAGPKTFSASCDASAKFTGVVPCKAMGCGTVTDPPHSTCVPKDLVFPQVSDCTCADGHALIANQHDTTTFSIKCNAAGGFDNPHQAGCVPIECSAERPVIKYTTSSGSTLFGGKITYTTVEGFTLDGTCAGEKVFTTECKADGTYTLGKTPLPVGCGTPKDRPHARGPGLEYVFEQKAEFSCLAGYSLDGKATGPKSFEITCGADCKYSGADECQPVGCGAVTTLAHSKQVELNGTKLSIFVFKQAAAFECLPGYSLNGKLSGSVGLKTTCLADGKFSDPGGECKNMDDCEGNQCGPNGSCEDHANPTGVHKDDYQCNCDSGYQELITGEEGIRTCANINDCVPEDTCSPGTCEDKVNDYKCHCPAGYLEQPRPGGGHKCGPKKCGKPPSVEKATTDKAGVDIFYAMPPVGYTCVEGYTLDSSPGGLTEFEIECLTDGKFSATKECLPVFCGAAPEVSNCTFNRRQEYVFSEKVTYTCDEGFSVDGVAGSATTFEAECMADASFSGVVSCLPVRCEAVEPQAHAEFDDGRGASMVFPQELTVTCVSGYALSATVHDKITYTIACGADGKLIHDGSACTPIDCGKEGAAVKYATVTGSTLFGGELVAEAITGFSLDGNAAGGKKATFACEATGNFSEIPEFQRITCGVPPGVPKAIVKSLKSVPPPLVTGLPSFLEKKPSFLQTAQARRRRLQVAARTPLLSQTGKQLWWRRQDPKPALFGDIVTYECKDGYRVDTNADGNALITEQTTFKMECNATGDLKSLEASGQQSCLPVVCPLPPPDVTFPSHIVLEKNPILPIVYKMKVEFACNGGYSLDGTPTGETTFTELCEKDANLTIDNTCKDIDFCIIGKDKCGKNGKCVDQMFDYRCDCNPGYESTINEEGFETCKNINECDTQNGVELCKTVGTCVDEIEKYKCDCATGYENEIREEDGLDSCIAVVCGAPPSVEHAHCAEEGLKLSFTDTAAYTCDAGYSVDGTALGKIGFDIECQADMTFTATKECKAIDCGAVPTVNHTTSDVTSLKFPEQAKYTCEEGYALGGLASGSKTFSVSCTAQGVITETEACLPVACGVPPEVALATNPTEPVHFGQSVKYDCQECHSTTGEHGGPGHFSIDCGKDGNFTAPEQCMPNTCGSPPTVKYALVPDSEYVCGDQLEIVCDAGYTTDGEALGAAHYVASCGKEGTFENIVPCQPVKCPAPPELPGSFSSDTPKVFKETAEYTCKEGFSRNGRETGGTTFTRPCGADGTYQDSTPADCVDINFCIGNPCTANGVCIDGGVGVVSPPYTCNCTEGYEVKKLADGRETCGKDDCNPDPCGEGGTCQDLSKRDPPGPQGQYACECAAGYELKQIKDGPPPEFTCVRSICGSLPIIDFLDKPAYTLQLWKGTERQTDSFTGLPILLSFDTATFVCQDGYSTDGSMNLESKSFSLECEGVGLYSRAVDRKKECQPVRCDNFELPSVPNTHVTNPKETYYVFGDSVEFECFSGYSLNGEVGGPKTFSLPCQESGQFSELKEQCRKINCGQPPAHKYATKSTYRKLTFEQSVSYNCIEGYTITGAADGAQGYQGACEASGMIQFSYGVQAQALTVASTGTCQPVSCGTVPPIPHATVSNSGPIIFGGDVVVATCDEGRTVGGIAGGMTSFDIVCQADGIFSGLPPTNQCQAPKFPVKGVVTDAESARIRINKAKIVYSLNGTVLDTAFSNWQGRYTVNVPAGTYTVTVTATGYIELVKTIVVAGPIQAGQGADIAIVKIMPPGHWKAVVSWAKHSRDIDSHTFFGDNFGMHVYWPSSQRGPKTVPSSNGVSAKLDRDDVDGWGPETTTFKGVGDCKKRGRCLILFKVKNYTPQDGDLGDSNINVQVWTGSTAGTAWPVPSTVGADLWYSVFTIDARTAKIYKGKRHEAPYVTNQETGNWYQSTGNTWSKTPQGKLLAGFKRDGSGLSAIDRFKSLEVRSTSKVECSQPSITSSGSGASWATCPEGEYLQGFLRYEDQVKGLQCCKVAGLPASYGTCTDMPIQSEGWTMCNEEDDWGYISTDTPSVMVGLEIAATHELTKARCCVVPDLGLLEGASPTTSYETQESTEWNLGTTSSWDASSSSSSSSRYSRTSRTSSRYSRSTTYSYSSSTSYSSSSGHYSSYSSSSRRRSYSFPNDDGYSGYSYSYSYSR